MGSDRARVSYDGQRQYRAVIMQQGRVTVEADWNEEWQIVNEEMRKDVLDIVGSCGTPDDGYRIVVTPKPPAQQYDFSVTGGTMYVGGVRAYLPDKVSYSQQRDWIDHPTPINVERPPKREFIYLLLQEQEVSAVEDYVLREVALGGPDTAQRLRLVQQIRRLNTDAQDCETALAEAARYWASIGYTFIRHDDKSNDMRLMPSGSLEASFQNVATAPDPCEPQESGGYLGADNQLIRVQVSKADTVNNNYSLLWGYDNASFLYRVTVVDDKTLKLATSPVDDFHKPRQGQAVEVLRSAVKLDEDPNDSSDYMASATGFVTTLLANYDVNTGYVSLNDPIPTEFKDTTETPVMFLRIWEEEKAFTLKKPVVLGDSTLSDVTGLQVTIQVNGGEALGVGTYWQIAVRPNTPTEVYPHRYLESPQPPDGPRIWVCPLAVIEWTGEGGKTLNVVEDCRNRFENLVELTKRNLSGCCTKTVRPGDDLKTIIDSLKNSEQAMVCLMPGTYSLPEPLLLGPEHSNLTLEACHDGVIIQAASSNDPKFWCGLIILNQAQNVTIRGLKFILPQAPLGETGVRYAYEYMPEVKKKEVAGVLASLVHGRYFSLGVLVLNCTHVTMKDCLLQFQSVQNKMVLGMAIFAVGECRGLIVDSNRFVRDEGPHPMGQLPLSYLYGYALSPILVFDEKGKPLVVAPLLQEASFRDNLFQGLSAATFVIADTGQVTFERNMVQDCYAGILLLSLDALALAQHVDDVSVPKEQIDPAQQVLNPYLAIMRDPIIQIGSVLLRGFPLPKEFGLSNALQVKAQRTSTIAKAGLTRMQTHVNRILSLVGIGITTKERVKIMEGVPKPSETDLIIGEGLQQLNALHAYLGANELAAFMSVVRKQLPLSLFVLNNDIDATLASTSSTSGYGVSVVDTEIEWDSSIIMHANKIRSRGQPTILTLSTALIWMVKRCAITGNLILNDVPDKGISLALLPDMPTTAPTLATHLEPQQALGVAVTGNVFRGTPILPPRPSFEPPVSAPMNRWEFLNTVITY